MAAARDAVGGRMESRWIEVGAGRGYLAVPESGSGPGLVIFAGTSGAQEPYRARRPLCRGRLRYARCRRRLRRGGEGAPHPARDGRQDRRHRLRHRRQAGARGSHRRRRRPAPRSTMARASAPSSTRPGEQGRPVMFHFADPDAAAFDRLRVALPRGRVFFYRGIAPGFAEADRASTSRPSTSPIPVRWSCCAACSGRATTSTRSGTATPSSNSPPAPPTRP